MVVAAAIGVAEATGGHEGQTYVTSMDSNMGAMMPLANSDPEQPRRQQMLQVCSGAVGADSDRGMLGDMAEHMPAASAGWMARHMTGDMMHGNPGGPHNVMPGMH